MARLTGHRILRASDHKRMPWKNGKGETVEIAAHPAGASVDDFDWRISTATVPNSGPFSRFADTDRVLAVLEGEMRLSVEGMATVTVAMGSPPLAFPGDSATQADVIRPVVDLNVMVRRGRFKAVMTRLDTIIVEPDNRERFAFFGAGARLADCTELTASDVVCLRGGSTLALGALPSKAWLVDIIAI